MDKDIFEQIRKEVISDDLLENLTDAVRKAGQQTSKVSTAIGQSIANVSAKFSKGHPAANPNLSTTLDPQALHEKALGVANLAMKKAEEHAQKKHAEFLNRQVYGSGGILGIDTPLISNQLRKGTFQDTLNTLKNDPNWRSTLDQKSFANTRDSIMGRLFQKSNPDISVGELLELKGTDNKPILSMNGFRHMNNAVGVRAMEGAYNQHIKNTAKANITTNQLRSFALHTGYVPTKDMLNNASAMARWGYMARTTAEAAFSPSWLFTGAGRDMMLSNMGVLTKSTKAQMAQSGMVSKTFLGLGMAAGAFGNAYIAASSDSPINESIATLLGSTGVQAGWRSGKSIAGLWKGGHMSRITLGSVGAVARGGLAYGLTKIAGDFFEQESVVADFAKKLSTREAFSFTPDTKATATMRQAALQKLSSSSLNNRGQLLGNEALALKGQLY